MMSSHYETSPSSPSVHVQHYMPFSEFFKRILLLGSLIVLGLGLWELRVVLMMTFLSIIIAISLDIPVRKLQDYGVQRGLAILVVTFITIIGMISLVTVIGTPVVEQTQNLIEELPPAIETLTEKYNEIAVQSPLLPTWDEFDKMQTNDEVSSILSAETLTGGALFVTSVGSFVVSLAVNLLLVTIVSWYLLADPETYTNSLVSLIPKYRQILVLRLLVDLRQALVGWLVSQLISMAIIMVMVWFSLGVLWGVPNSIALAMLAGILTFIPNFGSVIAAIPGLIFTLVDRPHYVLPVLITYFIVQQLESNLITPMIIKRRLHIPAAALLVFQVMNGVLFGFLGLLLAMPLFMVLTVLIRNLYVDDFLDNVNTAIESRKREDGETVLRITSNHHSTEEVPLKQIFDGDGPFDLTLQEVMHSLARRESNEAAENKDI